MSDRGSEATTADETGEALLEQAVAPPSAGDDGRDHETEELSAVVGANLKRIRVRQGLSLERLAKVAGVSRAMISQIELGRSVPTIGLLWKLARALAVPFASLISAGGASGTVVLRATKAKVLTSSDGSFTSRALFPFDTERRVEFYRLELAPQSEEIATPHQPGTHENIVVQAGAVEIDVAGSRHALNTDDAIVFEADVPHVYRNRGSVPAIMYLVMTYVEAVG